MSDMEGKSISEIRDEARRDAYIGMKRSDDPIYTSEFYAVRSSIEDERREDPENGKAFMKGFRFGAKAGSAFAESLMRDHARRGPYRGQISAIGIPTDPTHRFHKEAMARVSKPRSFLSILIVPLFLPVLLFAGLPISFLIGSATSAEIGFLAFFGIGFLMHKGGANNKAILNKQYWDALAELEKGNKRR